MSDQDPAPRCAYCGRLEEEIRRDYPGEGGEEVARIAYGPDGDHCGGCWSDYVAEKGDVSCVECGRPIEPLSVRDLSVEYICIKCDPRSKTRGT